MRKNLALITFFLTQILLASPSQIDHANKLFERQKFSEARDIYEEELANDSFTEKSLLRLAYLYEEEGKLPEAITLLRKAEINYGNMKVSKHLRALSRKNGNEYFFPLSIFSLFVKRYGLYLLVAALIVLITAYLYRRKNTVLTYSLTGIAVVLALITSTSYFNGPAFASPTQVVAMFKGPGYGHQTLGQITPGEQLPVTSKSDQWIAAEVNGNTIYLPTNAIKLID